MVNYRQLKLAELRELCDERGIDRRGLKKAQLVGELHAWDADNEAAGGAYRTLCCSLAFYTTINVCYHDSCMSVLSIYHT